MSLHLSSRRQPTSVMYKHCSRETHKQQDPPVTFVRQTHKETSIPIVSLCCLIQKKESPPPCLSALNNRYALCRRATLSVDPYPRNRRARAAQDNGNLEIASGQARASHMRDVCLFPPKGLNRIEKILCRQRNKIIGLLYYSCPKLPRGECK